ncbi:di-heme oxidoredictase family protein [Halalkalibacter okhensis]|uniref:di-heme oxidoredictase family protein n=1 Tax=Halalkalibacter okhensis TaxID=333138 RepID=UPI000AA5E65B|nr:di-heme oxidoredictase family protein [Halalkalibacter okhensis]
MKKWNVLFLVSSFVAICALGLSQADFEYGYVPDTDQILNEHKTKFSETVSYDVMGKFLTEEDIKSFTKAEQRKMVSPENGAVKVDQELIDLGKELFYKETFGNEIFLTDILGFIDGPFGIPNIMKAIMELKGEATTNLRVELSEDVTIGEQSWKKGDKIDTGLDVAKGAVTPLGIPISYSNGRVRAGLSCAACHATVDLETGKVMEGVPNLDFDSGLITALATNSAAFFPTAEIDSIRDYIRDTNRTIENTKGEEEELPDPVALEKAVDKTFIKWPKGNFDTTPDLVANPTQTPHTFTFEAHPYGWNGFSLFGPFRGLSTFNNEVHSFNSDSLSFQEHSEDLFGVDKEVYMGTILQNSAHKKYKYDVTSNQKPSDFFQSVDDTPNVPGVNEGVIPPTFPNLTMITPNATIVSSIGTEVGRENNALSAYQNTIAPPTYRRKVSEETKATGREVFERAGCISCHAGRTFTNHQIIPVEEIKTEPTRALSMKQVGKQLRESYMYAPNTPTPLPDNPTVLKVPTDHINQEQKKLAFNINSKGGYKVKSLVGLAYTAPYLHDGAVAVGPDEIVDLGVPGTLMKGRLPNPYNSLKAIIDKELRQKVIAANESVPQLRDVHVLGIGHEYWVDGSTGFTEEEQKALIDYLLSGTSPNE